MNIIDVILAVIFLYSAYRGFKKGLIVQAASLVALLLGIYGAIHFSDYTARLLSEKLELTSSYLPIISFAVTFIAIVIIVHLFAGLIESLLKAVALGFVNRLLGLSFAVIKSAFIISIILVIVNGINRRSSILPKQMVEESILYKPVSKFAPTIFPYLNFQDMVDQYKQGVEKINI